MSGGPANKQRATRRGYAVRATWRFGWMAMAAQPRATRARSASCLLRSSQAVADAYGLYGAGAPHAVDYLPNGVVQCRCERCEAWCEFTRSGGSHGQPIYLLPTCDLVEGLALWLVREHRKLAAHAPMRVLEVGAGDGTLALHLRAALSRSEPPDRANPITVVASDSGELGLVPAAGIDVLAMSTDAALDAVAPHIVICAFMPLGHDWTAAFRACPSVRRYLLLGEVDEGCCGRPWATWGYLCDGDDDAEDVRVSSTSGSSSDEDEEEQPSSQSRSYRADEAWRRVYEYEPLRTPHGAAGWERAELVELQATLVCRTDQCWSGTRHAKAIVFSRERDP